MEHFLWILTRPDNVPIVAMVFGVIYLLWVWWKQARRNDQLIDEGKKDDIGEEMRR